MYADVRAILYNDESSHCIPPRYAVEPDPATKKKAAEPPRVLKDADCPVMVAEWFTDRPR